MSHELSKEKDMSSYFAKKFAPAPPVCVLGRSYRASPECKPEHTLFDNWMEHSRTHRHPEGTILAPPSLAVYSVVVGVLVVGVVLVVVVVLVGSNLESHLSVTGLLGVIFDSASPFVSGVGRYGCLLFKASGRHCARHTTRAYGRVVR